MTIAIHTEQNILAMLASGKYSDTDIANQVELSPQSIARFRKANQDKIDQYVQKIYNRLPPILENDFKLITLASRVLTYLCDPSLTDNVTGVDTVRNMIGVIKQANELGKEYKQAVGVSPTHTTAPAVVNFNQQNNYGPLSQDQLDFLRFRKQQAKQSILENGKQTGSQKTGQVLDIVEDD